MDCLMSWATAWRMANLLLVMSLLAWKIEEKLHRIFMDLGAIRVHFPVRIKFKRLRKQEPL